MIMSYLGFGAGAASGFAEHLRLEDKIDESLNGICSEFFIAKKLIASSYLQRIHPFCSIGKGLREIGGDKGGCSTRYHVI